MPDDDKTPSSSEMVSLFSKRKHSDGVEPGSGGVVDDTEAHQLQAQVLAPDFGSDLEANPPLKPKNPDVKGKYTGTEHVQEYDVFADTSEDGPNYRNVRAQNDIICLGDKRLNDIVSRRSDGLRRLFSCSRLKSVLVSCPFLQPFIRSELCPELLP